MGLAEMLGLQPATVSRKIAGKTAWSVDDLVKTAAFLDVSILDLLPEETVELEKAKSSDLTRPEDFESHLWESNPRPSHYE